MNTPLPLVTHFISVRKLRTPWRSPDLATVWKILTQDLTLLALTYTFKIQALVLLPDRFDLLFAAPMPEVQAALRELRWRIHLEISERGLGRGYASSIAPTRVGSLHHAKFIYKYVYRGPVRAGLSARVEDYPFSTLAGLCGQVHLPIPIASDERLFKPYFNFATLAWLNTPSEAERMRGNCETSVESTV